MILIILSVKRVNLMDRSVVFWRLRFVVYKVGALFHVVFIGLVSVMLHGKPITVGFNVRLDSFTGVELTKLISQQLKPKGVYIKKSS